MGILMQEGTQKGEQDVFAQRGDAPMVRWPMPSFWMRASCSSPCEMDKKALSTWRYRISPASVSFTPREERRKSVVFSPASSLEMALLMAG